jgi:general secretion pathway protein F
MKYFKISYRLGKKRASIVLKAKNKVEAIEAFYNQNLGVMIKVQEVSKPIEWIFDDLKQKYQNPIKSKPADTEKLVAIFDQVAIMLDAGLPLNYVIAESIRTQSDPMLKAIFSNIVTDIESGKGFYQAALPYKKQLGFISLSMIQLGEETGTLAESLTKLTTILQNILDNRKKFKKATRYPIFIMVAMSIAFSVVTLFVIPQFKDLFTSTKMELPLPTQFLLWLEYALREYGPFILMAAVIIAVGINYMYKKSANVRFNLDKLLLKIYIIGKATLYAMVSRFVYVFQVLVEAGIPMIDALHIAEKIVDNSYLKRAIAKIPTAIEEGKSLHQGFEDAELFENMIVEMIKAGEMGGGLDKMLVKVSKVYKDRFDYIVDNIATMIEPILIMAIAGFVLVLALGIFLPMWNLVDLAG